MRVPSRAADPAVYAPGAKRELALALTLTWLLVLARSAVFLIYEQSFFDSDQANFGLMAKHLSEGRAFPLFCYGQTYMLGVDAWLAVPWFWIAGPTVAALHASLTLTNLVAVTLVIVTLWQACGLRPLLAAVACLPFTFAPPLTAASLIEAAGSIGPFVYVPLLWRLRDRPLWFGTVLGIGFLHREFTAYVVPVLLMMQAWDRTLWRPERLKAWLVAGAAGLVTWQFVQELKPYADMMGPGTRGQLIRGYGGSQMGNIADRMSLTPAELPGRIAAMFSDNLPRLLGAKHVTAQIAVQGHDWLYWPLAIGLVAALVRATWRGLRPRVPPGIAVSDPGDVSAVVRTGPDASFAWYLTGVGTVAVAAYIATRSVDSFVDRYLLLALYLPIGVAALFFTTETVRWSRGALVALMLVWTAGSAADHWRQVERYRGDRDPNDVRRLADALVQRGLHVAISSYWRAYKLTFLTRERVKIASSDYVRIDEYQDLANAEGDKLLTIQEQPCPGGESIAGWYLCK